MYYCGSKKITCIQDFTGEDGEVIVDIGDSIAYRYELKNKLGSGSFGQVFKAFDHKKKELVAIKIIKNNPKLNKQAKV